jgi:hypothetical protein
VKLRDIFLLIRNWWISGVLGFLLFTVDIANNSLFSIVRRLNPKCNKSRNSIGGIAPWRLIFDRFLFTNSHECSGHSWKSTEGNCGFLYHEKVHCSLMCSHGVVIIQYKWLNVGILRHIGWSIDSVATRPGQFSSTQIYYRSHENTLVVIY